MSNLFISTIFVSLFFVTSLFADPPKKVLLNLSNDTLTETVEDAGYDVVEVK
jgi:hypothetical protein